MSSYRVGLNPRRIRLQPHWCSKTGALSIETTLKDAGLIEVIRRS